MKKQVIDKSTYEEYNSIISERKALLKKVNTYYGCTVGVVFFVALILMTAGNIPWGFVGFGIALLSFLITNFVLWLPYCKYQNAINDYEDMQDEQNKRVEENLRKQQEANAQNLMERLDDIKKTVIVETHTGKDNDDTMNRGVIGGLLFGATGAIVGTATAQEKSYTTFLIIFNDDTRTTQTVENGSTLYNHYIKYLEV